MLVGHHKTSTQKCSRGKITKEIFIRVDESRASEASDALVAQNGWIWSLPMDSHMAGPMCVKLSGVDGGSVKKSQIFKFFFWNFFRFLSDDFLGFEDCRLVTHLINSKELYKESIHFDKRVEGWQFPNKVICWYTNYNHNSHFPIIGDTKLFLNLRHSVTTISLHAYRSGN